MDDADITERDLPGIGRRYTCHGDSGDVVAVIHHSGRRDLYLRAAGVADEEAPSVSLTDDQARRLGAILAGAYFKPAAVRQVEAVIGGLLIDWVDVRPDSPGAGHTIAELEIRRRTRMTVAAVVHADGTSVIAPVPEERIEAGDRLVVIGRPEDLPTLLELIIA